MSGAYPRSANAGTLEGKPLWCRIGFTVGVIAGGWLLVWWLCYDRLVWLLLAALAMRRFLVAAVAFAFLRNSLGLAASVGNE